MPNWVVNEMTLYGDKETIKKLMEKCRSVDEYGEVNVFDFNGIVPTPSNIYQGDLGSKEEKLYGKNTWYDWNCDNWGTKWNSVDASFYESCDGLYHVTFNTAWSAPIPIFDAIHKQYPNLRIVVNFADEDLGNNCGIYDNGNIVWDEDMEDPFAFACDMWGYDVEEMKEEYGIA